jgi:hypothetical protein
MRNAYEILIGKPGEKNHLRDQGVDGCILLKSVVKEID